MASERLKPEEILIHLKKHPLFMEICKTIELHKQHGSRPREAYTYIEFCEKILHVEAGQSLIECGEEKKPCIYFFIYGALEIWSSGKLVGTITEPQFFGENGITSGKRNATVKTMKYSCIAKLPTEWILSLPSDEEKLFRKYIQEDTLRKLSQANDDLSQRVARENRLAEMVATELGHTQEDIQRAIQRVLLLLETEGVERQRGTITPQGTGEMHTKTLSAMN